MLKGDSFNDSVTICSAQDIERRDNSFSSDFGPAE